MVIWGVHKPALFYTVTVFLELSQLKTNATEIARTKFRMTKNAVDDVQTINAL